MSSLDEMLPMYDGINGSPITTLMNQYNTGENTASITVRDGSKLPDAPNICTIYTSAGANSGLAVIRYETKIGNILAGISVEYKNKEEEITFPVGTFVSRKYSEEDHNAFKTNIEILTDMTRALVDYVQPSPTIDKFLIPDLPSMSRIGSQYIGEHTLIHKELAKQFIDGNMELYEQGVKIKVFEPSIDDEQVNFNANLHFDTSGEYVYTLKCKNLNGSIVSKDVKTVVMSTLLYVGHSLSDTMTPSIMDAFTVYQNCYDGMTVNVTANNDYVWFCIVQPISVEEVSSYGFTVPMTGPQVVSKQIGSVTVLMNCYRTTARVVAGRENTFKLTLNMNEGSM